MFLNNSIGVTEQNVNKTSGKSMFFNNSIGVMEQNLKNRPGFSLFFTKSIYIISHLAILFMIRIKIMVEAHTMIYTLEIFHQIIMDLLFPNFQRKITGITKAQRTILKAFHTQHTWFYEITTKIFLVMK